MWKLRKSAGNKLSTHHNNARGIWWSEDQENKTRLKQKLHKAFHILFDIMPPHIMIKYLINISCKSLTEETKDKLFDILNSKTPLDLYKAGTIKNAVTFIESCDKYSWVKRKK